MSYVDIGIIKHMVLIKKVLFERNITWFAKEPCLVSFSGSQCALTMTMNVLSEVHWCRFGSAKHSALAYLIDFCSTASHSARAGCGSRASPCWLWTKSGLETVNEICSGSSWMDVKYVALYRSAATRKNNLLTVGLQAPSAERVT